MQHLSPCQGQMRTSEPRYTLRELRRINLCQPRAAPHQMSLRSPKALQGNRQKDPYRLAQTHLL